MLSMEKFIEWFGRNRKTIGYVVGGTNVGSGIADVSTHNHIVSFRLKGSSRDGEVAGYFNVSCHFNGVRRIRFVHNYIHQFAGSSYGSN